MSHITKHDINNAARDLIQLLSEPDHCQVEAKKIFDNIGDRIDMFLEFSKGEGDVQKWIEANRMIYGKPFSYNDSSVKMELGNEDIKNLDLKADGTLVNSPRPYLNQYLNDKAHDKSTIKCRQCLPGYILVCILENGKIKHRQIIDLWLSGYRGKILYNKDGVYTIGNVIDVWYSGLRSILKIVTYSGHWLKCSLEEKVWDQKNKKFVLAKDLKNGDLLNIFEINGQKESKIKEIHYLGIEETYDLTISDEKWHNFYANGILVSNSEFTENEINANIYLCATRPYTNIRHIFPTAGMSNQIAKEKISPGIEKSPRIARLLNKPYNQTSKSFQNGSFYTVDSSWTDHQGRGPSSDKLTFDEYDFQNPQIESIFGESTSHSSLGLKTRISTPTFPNRGIDKAFEDGCGYEWFVTCPKCKKQQILSFPDNLINFFDIGFVDVISENYNDKLNKVYIGCKYCGKYLDRSIAFYVKKSIWIPQKQHLILQRSSYRVSYMMLPWKTGKEILYKYHTMRFVHQFWNEIMGLAYLDKESQVTREIFERCQNMSLKNAYQRLGNAKNVSIGVDWGTVSWAVVRANGFAPDVKKPRVIYVERIDNESLKNFGFKEPKQTDHAKRVADMIKYFNAKICINDANGIGVDRNSYLVKRFPTRAYGAFYDTNERKKQKEARQLITPQWSDTKKTVTVSRLGSMKQLIQEYEEQRVDIPRLDPEIEEFIQQHANIVVEKYEDESGAVYEVIGDCGPDHFCFVGSTLIMTNKGEVCIKDLKVGDYVLTRKGFRQITCFMDNGIREVFDFYINNKLLRSTYDHPVFANKDFKPISELEYLDDIINVSQDNLSFVENKIESIVVENRGKERVYNITVYGEHEYFANGILVSNCHADLYAMIGFERLVNIHADIPAGVINSSNDITSDVLAQIRDSEEPY